MWILWSKDGAASAQGAHANFLHSWKRKETLGKSSKRSTYALFSKEEEGKLRNFVLFFTKVTSELKQEVSDAAQEVLNDPEVKVEKSAKKRVREESQTDDQVESEETREVNFCRDLGSQSDSRVFF